MANPRQRRKARSGKYTGATKSARRAANKRINRAPAVMGPAVLREHWDPKLTVRQKCVQRLLTSYAKLGLVPTLSNQSGGLDPNDPFAKAMKEAQEAPAQEQHKPKPGMARIIRDEQGKVVDIIENEKEEEPVTPWGAELNQDEKREPSNVMLPPVLNNEKGVAVEGLSLAHQNLSALLPRMRPYSATLRWANTHGCRTWCAPTVTTTRPCRATGRSISCKRHLVRSAARTYLLTSIRKAGGIDALK